MPKSIRYSLTNWAVGALLVLNVCITIWHATNSFRRVRSAKKIEYTYSGNSIPLLHPVQSKLPPVAMTLQESTHYAWTDPSNATRDEYNSLFQYPALSFLGPNYRMTITSWYHNFHCIAQIRTALFNHNDEVANPHHFAHCLQYLRQFLLCGSSEMLEEGDFMEKDFSADRVGSDLICQDWEYAFDALAAEEAKFREWYANGQVDV
ncbi:hypothetical protein Moror_12745 [Moniliophthora roreri MCA 2997]|uniref:Oxidase ustYa n=2 Tax=Moniliophthora roreri TaxID=221103 RepID=V2XSE0_MONRO|nr:hypothetical protein Moror_12745 [Moniliophthora roreri MCA 2997]KAI3617983.1 hypothetical protein WG66_005513 [Moniliophthora roreri]